MDTHPLPTPTIRPAEASDIDGILALVNAYAAQNLMLPRTPEQIRRALPRFLVAVANGRVVVCGSLVELTPALVELRSLAVDPSQRGTGLGKLMVARLIEAARASGYEQLCALTLTESFFQKCGFTTVDRWTISPKIWHECIYCPKFNACDEIAMLMELVEPAEARAPNSVPPAWILRPGWARK
jgi:amino-acid N-acetyltransferase